jgi:hypothetical protein
VLETATETQNGASKAMCEIDDKNRLKNSLYPHRYFMEHLVDVFEKSSRRERFETRVNESFDPVTQEQYRDEILQQTTQGPATHTAENNQHQET